MRGHHARHDRRIPQESSGGGARPSRWIFGVLGVTLVLAGSARGAESIDYAREVKPLLKQRCYACHGALKRKAGLRLDTGAAVRKGGDGGPAVEPGHSEESLLVERLTESDPKHRMPPEGAPLTEEQIARVRAWIDQGATSPKAEPAETDPREHWAFRVPVQPNVPKVKNAAWVRNPIDEFLLNAQERRGLAPLPAAAPEVLLRRLYLDLMGLPPTREQLHEFLRDPSDAAYAKIVERLLSSPQYGERWARHWMDVWRYSDWYGRRTTPDVLNSYAQIWRWRDWIVRSLNEDKPYDRMVQEMLAADELAPTDDANMVATGFLVRNWYRWNYNLWMKDNIEHTGKAFLGLTLNCAHCHDHKYDPITQEEYFAFRAFFEPLELRHDRVPGEPDPGAFPKYEYGKAYPAITSGMIRVFDEKLDAKTLFYTRGESRNVVAGRPPVSPGVPAALGGRSFKVEPVAQRSEAYYPGLKPFVQNEEIAKREASLAGAEHSLGKARELAATAERALASAEAKRTVRRLWGSTADWLPSRSQIKLRAEHEGARLALRVAGAECECARADLRSVRARVNADNIRYRRTAGDADSAARVASFGERQWATAVAELEAARADQALLVARGKNPGDSKAQAEVAAAKKRQADSRKTLDRVRTDLVKESKDYTPLSPVYPSRSTGRRLALARWITARSNPLASRVAINHIWRWHFGMPLVATTHDFGRNGKAPTHPELLDWLAVELMDGSTTGARPWSLKSIHRLMVTSAAYRMASHAAGGASPNSAIDRDNQWYWHFPASRMEAEELRDSLLHVAGELDTTVGGRDIDFSQGLTSRRRSLYFTHHGEGKMAFLELFDAPDPCDAYRRATSVVPQQALALVNNELLVDLSRKISTRLGAALDKSLANGADADRAFVTAAFEQVLSRSPSSRETEVAAMFLKRQTTLLGRANGSNSEGSGTGGDSRARARRDLVQVLFSHNDFITVH